jgi:hypothetical protein
MRSLRRNGDPIKESSADPRRAPETAYGGSSINPGSNKMIMDLIARTKAGEFDGQLPSGKVDTADPLFDLLSLGSGQLGVRAIKRGVGEAGEAVAKQAAKGVKPFTRMKGDLDLNRRELDALLVKYEDAYDDLSDFKSWFSSNNKGVAANSDNFLLNRREQSLREAEDQMSKYGLTIESLKKRLSELTKESY